MADKTPWNGGLVGINSFGFGGANCHVLLDWNNKSKVNNGLPEDDLPRLVVASGRTEEAVASILNDVSHIKMFSWYLLMYDSMLHFSSCQDHWIKNMYVYYKMFKQSRFLGIFTEDILS